MSASGAIVKVLLLGFVFAVGTAALGQSGSASLTPRNPAEPAGIATGMHLRTFDDPTYKVSFEYPANYNFTKSDREVSTFRLDARSAAKKTTMRAVVSMSSNPYPASTFSGAYFYFSVTPHSSAGACAQQAANTDARKGAGHGTPGEKIVIGDIPFTHGHDEQRQICTVQRDDVYTTFRRGACYRFDLSINNFCGGEVSGVKDISEMELDEVRGRLEGILKTVRFGGK